MNESHLNSRRKVNRRRARMSAPPLRIQNLIQVARKTRELTQKILQKMMKKATPPLIIGSRRKSENNLPRVKSRRRASLKSKVAKKTNPNLSKTANPEHPKNQANPIHPPDPLERAPGANLTLTMRARIKASTDPRIPHPTKKSQTHPGRSLKAKDASRPAKKNLPKPPNARRRTTPGPRVWKTLK